MVFVYCEICDVVLVCCVVIFMFVIVLGVLG